MLRPDKVRAVAGLSIPPILPGGEWGERHATPVLHRA